MHNASPHFAQDEDLEDGGNQAQTIHLPSYADLNSISQFNYPDDYLGSSRIYVSNNLKVDRIFPINLTQKKHGISISVKNKLDPDRLKPPKPHILGEEVIRNVDKSRRNIIQKSLG